jgi:hypothetical protein
MSNASARAENDSSPSPTSTAPRGMPSTKNPSIDPPRATI